MMSEGSPEMTIRWRVVIKSLNDFFVVKKIINSFWQMANIKVKVIPYAISGTDDSPLTTHHSPLTIPAPATAPQESFGPTGSSTAVGVLAIHDSRLTTDDFSLSSLKISK